MRKIDPFGPISMGIPSHRRDSDPPIGIWRAPVGTPVPNVADQPLSEAYEFRGFAEHFHTYHNWDLIQVELEWVGDPVSALAYGWHQLVAQFGGKRTPDVVDKVRSRSVLYECKFDNWRYDPWSKRGTAIGDVKEGAEMLIGAAYWAPARNRREPTTA